MGQPEYDRAAIIAASVPLDQPVVFESVDQSNRTRVGKAEGAAKNFDAVVRVVADRHQGRRGIDAPHSDTGNLLVDARGNRRGERPQQVGPVRV